MLGQQEAILQCQDLVNKVKMQLSLQEDFLCKPRFEDTTLHSTNLAETSIDVERIAHLAQTEALNQKIEQL